ncbi:ras GEF [Neolentinus lepideus HHB14362 ss-1]|uniref:Ras GEF n=1 Tax=Neolentinus lepideus HHB14362 ss-1 TaxID=1314782 RepID=A0A165PPR6_9AGAM|nr:ras GEF [Neolentinus lepideus HHB14362 ss-1]
MLPITNPPARPSFTVSDVYGAEEGSNGFEELPPEIASADISIAPDGSFVETSSAAAAMELKRRYDYLFGVNKEVRSPYAITSFLNQHGRQRFRIGRKELSAPMASAAEAEHRMSQQTVSGLESPPYLKHSKRISKILPTLGKGSTAISLKPGMASRSPSGHTNKLRKTRSIPDMYSGLSQGLVKNEIPGAPTNRHPTGRTHSQSVTAADIPRLSRPSAPPAPQQPSGDVFSDVMGWEYSAPSSPFASSIFSVSVHSLHLPSENGTQTAENESRPLLIHPFGPGISFDSPSRKTSAPSTRLSSPHGLRVMQSFESGLTARADTNTHLLKGGPPKLTLNFESEPEGSTLLSIPSHMPSPAPSPPRQPSPVSGPSRTERSNVDPSLLPSWETCQYSRYSTDVFDVLQTYRGLPLLDKIDPFDGSETTIKLKSDETAAPRDDPRFVIWGEVHPAVILDPELQSLSQASKTDLSSRQSVLFRKSSVKGRNSIHSGHNTPSLRISTEGGRKVLVAATIERWIAQLTSELNYDELLNFFLTYRTYIGALDLAQLLICRFHWALGPANSAHDDMVRRIVRVRTFVALRYWLLTFFPVDFLPNRELRLLFAHWLNTLRRDAILTRHKDALSIVRKLMQVVKDCKEAHTRKNKDGNSKRHSTTSKAKQFPAVGHSLGDLSDSRKFAESLRKAAAEGEEDSDVDLDFGLDEGALSSLPQGFPSQKEVTGAANVQTSGRGGALQQPTSVPSAALAVLQQPLQMTILKHANAAATDSPFVQTSATLPVHHSTLSRVLVKTIGRLGRWRRVLNQRASPMAPTASADVSAFDVELSMGGDLLNVPGGVEQYLKMIEQPEPELVRPDDASGESTTTDNRPVSAAVTASSLALDPVARPRLSLDSTFSSSGSFAPSYMSEETDYGEPISHLRSVTEASEEGGDVEIEGSRSSEEGGRSEPSIHPASRDSLVSYESRRAADSVYRVQQRPWQPVLDVVSIDDLEFSDMSSSDGDEGPAAPPGLRRVPRRLPLRRDFEFVRRSDSVSSLGIRSHSSMASNRSSVVSSGSIEPTLGPGLQQWQVNAIVDSLSDDDEEGDVEAALRRLEGQISRDEQRLKSEKVDGWVQTIRERLANGDYTDEPPRFPTSDSDSDHHSDAEYSSGAASAVWSPSNPGFGASSTSISPPSTVQSQDLLDPAPQSADTEAVTPLASQTSHNVGSTPNPSSPISSSDGKPVPEDVVPVEILKSRVPSRPSTSGSSREPSSNGFAISSPSNKFITSSTSQPYRSFVLGCRAETLAQHFSVIDRELFLAIKFEEIVSDDWMGCPNEANVLDWSQFLRDRARWKAESRGGPKTSAVIAARGRFNLVSNFVVSEVILTHPQHRPVIVGKLIRVAWKAYNMNNFNTLTAIIAGLRNDWVNKAMRRSWSRIGVWEQRMFQDLKVFTSRDDDFKHIRHAISAMIETKPITTGPLDASMNGVSDAQSSSSRSRAASDTKPHAPPACIPFLGLYLAQMQRYHKLPDLIDPTAPNEAIGIDAITGNLEAPAHPEVFSSLAPLPPSMQLEPLINVQKQRLIAGVIKSLVAGQHLASRVQFPLPLDKKIFQRCVKLRALDTETLQRAYAMYSD